MPRTEGIMKTAEYCLVERRRIGGWTRGASKAVHLHLDSLAEPNINVKSSIRAREHCSLSAESPPPTVSIEG